MSQSLDDAIKAANAWKKVDDKYHQTMRAGLITGNPRAQDHCDAIGAFINRHCGTLRAYASHMQTASMFTSAIPNELHRMLDTVNEASKPEKLALYTPQLANRLGQIVEGAFERNNVTEWNEGKERMKQAQRDLQALNSRVFAPAKDQGPSL